jgi:hypothetical protein
MVIIFPTLINIGGFMTKLYFFKNDKLVFEKQVSGSFNQNKAKAREILEDQDLDLVKGFSSLWSNWSPDHIFTIEREVKK